MDLRDLIGALRRVGWVDLQRTPKPRVCGETVEPGSPHVNPRVLHAPGTCPFCDEYPGRQAGRRAQHINFTGERDPQRARCPSEHRDGP